MIRVRDLYLVGVGFCAALAVTIPPVTPLGAIAAVVSIIAAGYFLEFMTRP